MRLACLLIPHFPVAALLRSEPGLRDRPLAVIEGIPPASTVLDASIEATESGVRAGVPEAEAIARCPGIALRPASAERDRAAHEALLAVALGTSPRVEEGAPGMVFVDVDGLAGLFGAETQIAERLAQQARAIGLPGHVGVAGSRAAARAAARLGRGVTIVPAGEDRTSLAGAPLALLELAPELEAVFARWGLRTLGDVAALPRSGLAARLGARGLAAQDLARGIDGAPFRPYVPPPFYGEVQGLEWEIESLDALAAVMLQLVERLTARLRARQLATDQLDLRLGLADRRRHDRRIELAYPMDEPRSILTLLCMDLEAHPPEAGVVHVALSAHAVDVTAEQATFTRPPGPGARDLTVVLARLTALVGTANLGSPALVDSHRPDGFAVTPFRPDAAAPPRRRLSPAQEIFAPHESALALRRLRPPMPVRVEVRADRPVRVAGPGLGGHIVACAGPWRRSGEWWREDAWAWEEWDVALSDRTLCRLARDESARQWVVHGIYD
jgi:protein ImuB